MAQSFIEPSAYTRFGNEADLIEKCKIWGLLTGKAAKAKTFQYKGGGRNLACTVVGCADEFTAVIEFEDKQLHCIHPSYLKEMQSSSFNQRGAASAADEADKPEAAEPEAPDPAPDREQIPAAPQHRHGSADDAAAAHAAAAAQAEAPPSGTKPRGGRGAKLELPEEKVSIRATVKDFTTVPNNFSDSDDEVVIYDAVAIEDPVLEVGAAWSSHSATLKKLALEVGDTLAFEAKIVAKKLTKHPVPYKINNPAKIRKV